MRVTLRSITVSDTTRRALSQEYGHAGRATREQVREYLYEVMQIALDGLATDYLERQRHRHERADARRAQQQERRTRRQARGEAPQHGD